MQQQRSWRNWLQLSQFPEGGEEDPGSWPPLSFPGAQTQPRDSCRESIHSRGISQALGWAGDTPASLSSYGYSVDSEVGRGS